AVPQGDDGERTCPPERALLETQPPSGPGLLAEGEAADEHPVEPALEDGRHPVPPQRELDDERVGPAELGLLPRDVGGDGTGELRGSAVPGDVESPGHRLRVDVVVADHRVPPHRVEVGLDDVVALGPQSGDAVAAQAAVERLRLGVGAHPQDGPAVPVRSRLHAHQSVTLGTQPTVRIFVSPPWEDGPMRLPVQRAVEVCPVEVAVSVLGGTWKLTLVKHLAEGTRRDRKSTRLNSSHVKISYAVFC